MPSGFRGWGTTGLVFGLILLLASPSTAVAPSHSTPSETLRGVTHVDRALGNQTAKPSLPHQSPTVKGPAPTSGPLPPTRSGPEGPTVPAPGMVSTPTANVAPTLPQTNANLLPSGWGPLNLTAGPMPRNYASMAFDATDGKVLLFGGNDGTVLGDTWELSGRVWSAPAVTNAPVARTEASMAYDPADGYTVLFGGLNGAMLGDTWAFRDGAWTELWAPAQGPASGGVACDAYVGGVNTSSLAPCPSAREGASLAFDPAVGGLVLYGGENATANFGDTWTFRDGNWSELAPAQSPPWRSHASMAYDPSDGYLLLFGGLTTAGPVEDTWEFQGGTWSPVTTTVSPSPRSSAAMTFDETVGSIVLFGGFGANPLGDTWEYRAGAWTNVTRASSPAARQGASLTFDPDTGYSLLWGGASPSYLADPWGFKVATGEGWSLESGISVPMGQDAAAVFDPADGYLVAFGGDSSGFLQSTWTYRNGTWTTLEAPVNGPLAAIPYCYDYRNGVNTTTIVSCPVAREFASMTFDSHDGYLLLFGGFLAGNYLGDTWSFRGGNWTQREAADTNTTCWLDPPTDTITGACPDPTEGAGMAYDPEGGSVLLFGGFDGGTYYNDTWRYSEGAWTLLAPASPVPNGRYEQALVYDDADGYLLLFGGYGCANAACSPTYALNDTWEYRAGGWTNLTSLSTAMPPVTFSAGAAYDAADGAVLITAGQACLDPPSCSVFGPTNATWTYRGGLWSEVTATPAPPARRAPILAFDPAEGRILLGAGYSLAAPLTDMWSYVAPLSITSLSAVPGVIDLGQTSLLSTSASGGESPYSYAYSGLPGGCASANASSITCSPAATGSFRVGVRISDGTGYTMGNSTTLEVYPTPVVASLGVTPASADVGQSVTFTAHPLAGSNPSETYAWTPAGGLGCAPSTGNSLNCTPTASGTGYTVVVNMTDPTGAASPDVTSAPYTVDADPATTVPSVSPTRVDVGQDVNFSARVLAVGSGSDVLTWSGLPPGCVSSDSATIGPCPAQMAGNYTVSVGITDSNGFTTRNGSVLLTVALDPRAVAPIANRTSVDVGQSVLFTASGVRGTLPYSYAWSVSSSLLGCAPGTSPSLTCQPSTPGSYTVVVTVTDSRGVSSSNVSAPFSVFPLPSLGPLTYSRSLVDVGETVAFYSSLLSGGSGSPVYQLAASPGGMVCAPVGPGGNCTASVAGNFTATLTVTDTNGGTASSTSGPLQVDPDPVAGTPTFSPAAFPLGGSTTIGVVVTGGAGNNTYVWAGLPRGCSSHASSFRCTPSLAGTFDISVTVTDATGFNTTSPVAVLSITGTSPTYQQQEGGPAWWLAFLAIGIVVVALVAAGAGARLDREPKKQQRRSGR